MKRVVIVPFFLAVLALAGADRSARANDILYVGDGSDNTIKRFDADTGAFLDKALGAFVTSGSGGLHGPMGLIVSSTGELVVVNQNVNLPINGEVLRYSETTGAFIAPLIPSTDTHAPPAPRGLVLFNHHLFDASMVGSTGGPGLVQEFTDAGKFVADLSSSLPVGLAPTFFPRGVVIGPDGLLYVASDPGNGNFTKGGQVLTFDPATGHFRTLFIDSKGGATCNCINELNGPEGLVFSPDGKKLYITSFASPDASDSDKIIIADAKSGAFLGHIELDKAGQPPSPRAYAFALLFGPGGKLFAPITGATPLNGEAQGPFTGEVRRYDPVTKTFDVFVPPKLSGGPVGSGWYLTFGKTNPGTLQYEAAPPPTPTPTPTGTPTLTATRTATETPRPTPSPSAPHISAIPSIILVGSSFDIAGANFTKGSVVNFFVATSNGPLKAGTFTPSHQAATLLTVDVPVSTPLGQGFASVEVINTDAGFTVSNTASALLQGLASAGIPTITTINGVGLAKTSSDPNFATNNVETVVVQGKVVKIGGTGFDTANGVAIDLFCGCSMVVGPFFLNPGNPGLTSTLLTLPVPASGMPNSPRTGPGAFLVRNAGASRNYTAESNAVSVPIGAKISVNSVVQSGSTITVTGAGFNGLTTIINFFNTQPGGKVVNLCGLKAGAEACPPELATDTQLQFSVPAGAAPGPSYIQALNPPFVPFTSSGSDPGGAFALK